MLTEQQLAVLRSEPGSNRVAKAMALTGVTQVTVAKALGLTQPYVSDVARGRYRTISPENSWRVPIPVQTQEPPCGTSAVLTTTCATTEALA